MALSEYQKKRMEHIMKGRPLPEKKKYTIPNKSEKRKAKEAEQKAKGTDGEMDRFFHSMRKNMTGSCLFCGGKTQKKDDETFHFSLAHLLPKAIFPSVATSPDNIIELCFYGESCHTNFDNGIITWEFIKDSKEWDIIKEKLLNVMPMIAEEERKHKLYSKLNNLVYGDKH